jgi:hypothetical protein
MKFLLIVCLLLISTPSIASAQQSGKTVGSKQSAVGRALTKAGGETPAVLIEADSFVQVLNPANCVATNSHAVPFRVAGGTGGHAGATGHGRFHIASNLTPCNGITQPAYVWFEGVISRPQ